MAQAVGPEFKPQYRKNQSRAAIKCPKPYLIHT
jgi:hypothetical protein